MCTIKTSKVQPKDYMEHFEASIYILVEKTENR